MLSLLGWNFASSIIAWTYKWLLHTPYLGSCGTSLTSAPRRIQPPNPHPKKSQHHPASWAPNILPFPLDILSVRGRRSPNLLKLGNKEVPLQWLVEEKDFPSLQICRPWAVAQTSTRKLNWVYTQAWWLTRFSRIHSPPSSILSRVLELLELPHSVLPVPCRHCPTLSLGCRGKCSQPRFLG